MQQKNESPKITVVIRKRPLNKKQQQRCQTDIIKIQDRGSLVVSEMKQKVDLTKYIQQTTFNFDFAFDECSTNQQIYDACIQPLIESAFMGAKVSCFAYGQTGSGKTFTMKGDIEKGVPGLYYLGAKQIYRYLDQPQFQNLQVYVSFFEIYCGKLFDLLNNRTQLKIRQDKHSNINVIGMQQKYICSAQQFLDVIEYGSNFRVTSQNATNADSSRSHAILQIIIKNGKKTYTKISFIDLAGNERGADHMDQNKQTKIDGAQINKSLLALKQCIRALDQGKGHTPFRGSKLTMVLKDSFVGFCKTVMIGNVSPNVTSAENTMNTLRYADRVKQLKNGGGQNTPLTKQQIVARQMMLPRSNKNTLKVNINKNDDEQEIESKKQLARRNMNKNKSENMCEMDIQAPIIRRRTDVLPNQFEGVSSKNEITLTRKSMNQNIVAKPLFQPQDQNNPKNRHFNFLNKQTKQIIDSKNNYSKVSTINTNIQAQQSYLGRNKLYGCSRTQNSTLNHLHHQHKMQLDHHHMLQQIQNLQQQFFTDHFQTIREESYIIKEEGEQCDRAVKSRNIDLGVYIQGVQKKINRKLELFNDLKKKADYLAGKIHESNNLNKMIGDHGNFDQQLLQGLPIDDFGGKLF